MFDNVGTQIKSVARSVTWLGIIASVIGFMVFIGNEDTIGLAFAVLIVGCIGSWLSSLTLYGFGQLVENSDIIAGRTTIEKATENTSNNKSTASDNKGVVQKAAPKRAQTFEELVDNARLPQETISEVKRLKEMKDTGEISEPECRKKVRKLISDIAIDDIFIIMKKL